MRSHCTNSSSYIVELWHGCRWKPLDNCHGESYDAMQPASSQAATINAETGGALICPRSCVWTRRIRQVVQGSSMLVPAGRPDAVLRALQPLLATRPNHLTYLNMLAKMRKVCERCEGALDALRGVDGVDIRKSCYILVPSSAQPRI